MNGRVLKREEIERSRSELRPLYTSAPAGSPSAAALPAPSPSASEPVAERHARLLNRVVGEFVRERERLLDELRPQLLQLALAVAREIVGHEATADPLIIERTLCEALAQLHFASRVVVRLHPEDLAHLQEHPEGLAGNTAELEFVGDTRIERGGCVLESDRGGIDATLATQLRLLGESLAALSAPAVCLCEASGN